MSWQAHAWTRTKGKDYELTPTLRLLLRSLADFADKDGDNIYPSLATLELETGLSERTIRRSIKTLIDIGLLEYGDQSVVSEDPHYRRDRLPKVYRFVFTRDAAGKLDFASFGRLPQPKRKPWERKPKVTRETRIQPVEQPPALVENTGPPLVDKGTGGTSRPDTVAATTGHTDGHNVHQTVKSLKDNPLTSPPDPGPSRIDFGAVRALREAARARLARRGIHITAPLFGGGA